MKCSRYDIGKYKRKYSQNKSLGVGNYNQLPKKLCAFLNDFKNKVKSHLTGGVSDKQDANEDLM